MAEIEQGNAKETILGVLQYIDSPFKLGVVVLLALLAFSGYFVYQNQALLIGAYEKSQALPKMEYSRMESAAQLLFKATDADFVAILDVDPILGKRTVVRVFNKDMSKDKTMDGLSVPLFNSNKKNNEDAIKLMSGDVPCGTYDHPQSELGFFYISKGATYMCRISVPPTPNQFIGQISVGWNKQPKTDPVNFMNIASDMLTAKK